MMKMTEKTFGNMKSLEEISWIVTEEEYRKDPAYSYSTLAKFEREGFNGLSTLFDRVESPSLLFGQMVDSIITGGMTEFNERFFVADIPELPDGQKKITDYLISLNSGLFDINDFEDDVIIHATEAFKYQLNWKPETRAKVIKEKCGEYYNMCLLAKDKTVVTQELYNDTIACVDALKDAEATEWYFREDNPFDNVERLYQLKFKGEYEGIPVRCMMDLCVVLHDEKRIIPVDLKTSFKKEYDFPKSFIEWKYYIQATLYWEILKQNLAKDDYFKDFKLEDYRFIVVSNGSRVPLVWKFNQTQNVGDTILGESHYRNWREIVKELDYYLKTNPKVPKGIYLDKPNSIEEYFKCNR